MLKILSAISVALCSSSLVHAQLQLTWGGQIDSFIYAADGELLTLGEGDPPAPASPNLSNYSAELGIFQNGFIPSLSNASQWEDNWLAVPTANPQGSDGSIRDDGFFGSQFTFGNNDGVPGNFDDNFVNNDQFPIGSRLYIWGFDTQTFDNVPGTEPEWLLITGPTTGSTTTDSDNWLVPDSTIQTHDPIAPFLDIVSGNVVIVGRSSEGEGAGEYGSLGDVSGQPGDFQFATVPEPSSSLLVILSGLCLVIRRRK